MSESRSGGKINSLTGMRFVAGFMILQFHLWEDSPALSTTPIWFRNPVASGFTWVSFFFVLSGFVLTYRYLERAKNGTFDVRSFFRARFARLYPGYFLGFLITVAFYLINPYPFFFPAGGAKSATLGAGLTLLMAQAWIPRFALAYNAPAWAVSVEWFSYFLFPFLILFAARRSLKLLATMAGIALLVEIGICASYVIWGPNGWGTNTSEIGNRFIHIIEYMPVVRVPEFMVGVVAGRVYSDRATFGLTAAHGRMLAWIGAALIVIGAMASTRIPYALMHNVVLVLPSACLVLGLALSDNRGLASILSARPVVWIGQASYSLFILQYPFVLLVTESITVTRWATDYPFAIRGVLTLVIIAIALASFRWLETPTRLWIRGSSQKRSVGAAT